MGDGADVVSILAHSVMSVNLCEQTCDYFNTLSGECIPVSADV